MITARTELTSNSRVTYRDGDTIVGEILTTASRTGRQLFVALAHDWDGDSESYDPIVVDTTDDLETAAAEIRKRYAAWLDYLRVNGVTTTTTAEMAPELPRGSKVTVADTPGVWQVEQYLDGDRVFLLAHDEASESYLHSLPDQPRAMSAEHRDLGPWTPPAPAPEFDAQAAYDGLNPNQRAAMRNVLAVEDEYNTGAVTPRGAYSRVSTMNALADRGLLERKVVSLPFRGSGFKHGYRLTIEGRAVAALCEAKSVKLHHPADDGNPFAGMGTDNEEDL